MGSEIYTHGQTLLLLLTCKSDDTESLISGCHFQNNASRLVILSPLYNCDQGLRETADKLQVGSKLMGHVRSTAKMADFTTRYYARGNSQK
jgi:hypothetical protein